MGIFSFDGSPTFQPFRRLKGCVKSHQGNQLQHYG